MFFTDCFGFMVLKVELPGIGGYGAALYCGTGCFHCRTSLCGTKYSEEHKGLWNSETRKDDNRTVHELEEASKVLASCGFEKGTQWGKEVYSMWIGINIETKHTKTEFFLVNYKKRSKP